MGDLILCSRKAAPEPCYIRAASLNVYSIEELSYYIENNLYLLGKSFMDEELCRWMEEAFGLTETAEKMRRIRKAGGPLAEFAACILSESGYCTDVQALRERLWDIEHKSEAECAKLRADRYLENGDYACGILEYRRLLNRGEEDPLLAGNLWHNLGTAYVRLFRFREAFLCYRTAYEHNKNRESLRECLMACFLAGDMVLAEETARLSGVPPEELKEMEAVLSEAGKKNSGDIPAFSGGDSGKTVPGNGGDDAERAEKQVLYQLLENRKEQYRKNCEL